MTKYFCNKCKQELTGHTYLKSLISPFNSIQVSISIKADNDEHICKYCFIDFLNDRVQPIISQENTQS